jgi:hypothetical protein
MGAFGSSESNGWTRGMDAFYTQEVTDIKFWLSVNIGLQVAVALIGFWSVFRTFSEEMYRNRQNRGMQMARVPKGAATCRSGFPWRLDRRDRLLHRGERIPAHIATLDRARATLLLRLGLLIFYGLIWSPINSYISARMVGITGTGVAVPYLKEVAIMKSGYPYVDVWYAPIPLN